MEGTQLISTQFVDCGFVKNFCYVYLVKAQKYLILSNPT